MSETNQHWQRELALAAGGPAALGALLGCAYSADEPSQIVLQAVRVPGLVLGAALLMVPTLYIGVARFGLLPAGLSEIGRFNRQALARAGLVMLGLLPAVAFLGFSSGDSEMTAPAGIILAGLAGLVGARDLGQSLAAAVGGEIRLGHRLLFLGWCAVMYIGVSSPLIEGLLRRGR